MAEHVVDLDTWPRAAQFRFFRTFERPHYGVTVRLDVTHLMARKAEHVSPYRACLHAIGAGLHAVPELCMRFRGDTVVRHDRTALSFTVPRPAGDFNYAYIDWQPDFAAFDADAVNAIETARTSATLDANTQTDAVAYLSCLPWLDFTALDNAMPDANDCIPRIGWGRFTPEGDRTRVAMALQVHHALVDGAHIGLFFETVQQTLDAV